MFCELSSYNYLQCSSKSDKIPIYKEFQNVLDQCYTNSYPKGLLIAHLSTINTSVTSKIS